MFLIGLTEWGGRPWLTVALRVAAAAFAVAALIGGLSALGLVLGMGNGGTGR